jgi:prepilin-type N-terminal cleavage/methylation domain-containing protein
MRLSQRLTKLHERGDTIVEVLIAIAVISLILGGAYVTTNHSLLAVRDAQEHGDALKLTESQLEQLKGVISNDPNAVFGGSAPGSFCISNVTSVSASSSPSCTVDSSGTPTTNQPQYRIAITRSGNTFTIVNNWDTVQGNTTANIQMKYRLYP